MKLVIKDEDVFYLEPWLWRAPFKWFVRSYCINYQGLKERQGKPPIATELVMDLRLNLLPRWRGRVNSITASLRQWSGRPEEYHEPF